MEDDAMTDKVFQQIMMVRKTGYTNMYDLHGVNCVAKRLGCKELLKYLKSEENQDKYFHMITTGERPS